MKPGRKLLLILNYTTSSRIVFKKSRKWGRYPQVSPTVLEHSEKGQICSIDIDIDTEWRSNWKWDRLKNKIQPLEGRMILDIGCGNGYYGWRMLGEKAKHVVGMDPTLLFLMQFMAVKKYVPDANIDIVPLGIQSLQNTPLNFDTVFSMGVIYHRRDYISLFYSLRGFDKLFLVQAHFASGHKPTS